VLQKITISAFAVVCLALSALAAFAAPVVVMPLQELGERRNEVNLPFTRLLIERLAASGNEVNLPETVIAFLANNRIRTAGHLETFHLNKVWEELGAPLVLLGTVTQLRERPEPSLGLTLQLVRTSDARTVWSYIGSFSSGDERRIFGVGEPHSVAELQELLLADLAEKWPWQIISEMQQPYQISIDAFSLSPVQVPPGAEIRAWVRMRNAWPAGRAPRVFFKADDQLHGATFSAEGGTYQATWIAGERNGRFPVNLILEWSVYGRLESALLGTYVVDGTPPLLELEFRGTQPFQGMAVFRDELVIKPRALVRKPLERWRIAFYDETGALLVDEKMSGNLPEGLIWRGQARAGEPIEDGIYKVVFEAWDYAGNMARAEREVMRLRTAPQVALGVTRGDESLTVDLGSDERVPLAYWRMEMWTKEGKFLTHAEGKELPVQIGIDLPAADQAGELQGVVVVRDTLGNLTRSKVEDLLPKLKPQAAEAEGKKKGTAGVSESWVDEF
jgi:hypothetical protein